MLFLFLEKSVSQVIWLNEYEDIFPFFIYVSETVASVFLLEYTPASPYMTI